jgi:hypothetical protein
MEQARGACIERGLAGPARCGTRKAGRSEVRRLRNAGGGQPALSWGESKSLNFGMALVWGLLGLP